MWVYIGGWQRECMGVCRRVMYGSVWGCTGDRIGVPLEASAKTCGCTWMCVSVFVGVCSLVVSLGHCCFLHASFLRSAICKRALTGAYLTPQGSKRCVYAVTSFAKGCRLDYLCVCPCVRQSWN